MDVLFGLIGLVIMLAIGASLIIIVIALAKKTGLMELFSSKKEDGEQADQTDDVGNKIQNIKDSILLRFVLISILTAVMVIPLSMVDGVVTERRGLYQNVQHDIASTWGHRQSITGPSLLIPYTERFDTVEVYTDKEGNEHKKNKTVYKKRTAIVLPEDLNIDVSLQGESRQRSIYQALVYGADVAIDGSFVLPNLSELSNNINKVHWDRAWFSLGVADTQAINKVSKLTWGNRAVDFEPGTKITDLIASGFHAPIRLDNAVKNKLTLFSLKLNINGSEGFYFSPFGKTTNVEVSSDWPHPSFQGNVLPDSRDVSSTGFEAKWSIPHLARNYPQLWTLETQNFDINEFSAGVNLFESVSLYSQITRAIKYGVLFLVLTYITFLLFEMSIGQRLHVIQYGVIGLAISMFYLTLLSLSEHAGFFKSYVVASTIIVLMISAYVQAALKNIKRTGLITLILTGLYFMLYSMLRLEDYALLAGVSLLLVVLAVLMYLTRNISKES